jgi:hypothetical protein
MAIGNLHLAILVAARLSVARAPIAFKFNKASSCQLLFADCQL